LNDSKPARSGLPTKGAHADLKAVGGFGKRQKSVDYRSRGGFRHQGALQGAASAFDRRGRGIHGRATRTMICCGSAADKDPFGPFGAQNSQRMTEAQR